MIKEVKQLWRIGKSRGIFKAKKCSALGGKLYAIGPKPNGKELNERFQKLRRLETEP